MLTTYNLPSVCPHCGKPLDAATFIEGRAVPAKDDISLCMYCLAVSQFTEHRTLVALTDDQIAELPHEVRVEISHHRRTMREIKKRKGMP